MKIEVRGCLRCGDEFKPENPNQRYCNHCRKNFKKEINREYERICKQRKRVKKNSEKKDSLDSICADLDAYNRKHGTHLSYGQYVSMRHSGTLKGE